MILASFVQGHTIENCLVSAMQWCIVGKTLRSFDNHTGHIYKEFISWWDQVFFFLQIKISYLASNLPILPYFLQLFSSIINRPGVAGAVL